MTWRWPLPKTASRCNVKAKAVVGNSKTYSKFSALGLTASAKEFEQRFGTPRPAWRPFDYSRRRSMFAVDAVDITPFLAMYGFATKDDISDAIDEASTNRAKQFADAHQTSYMTWPVRPLFTTSTDLTPPNTSLVHQTKRTLPNARLVPTASLGCP